MLSALIIHGVPIECIHQASIDYNVPLKTVISVLEVENGTVGMAKKNSNGTYDFGPMQINSIWLKTIEPYGYTQQKIQYNPCVNVEVGTWIINQEMAGSNGFWNGVGDYHSHTPSLNAAYQSKVKYLNNMIAAYLSDQPYKIQN